MFTYSLKDTNELDPAVVFIVDPFRLHQCMNLLYRMFGQHHLISMEMSTFSTKDDVPIANEMKILFIFIAIWQFVFKVSNNAITNLAFLKFFVKILGGAFKNNTDLMSLNLKALHKCLQISKGDFITYVVCPERNSIYEMQDCVTYYKS